MSLFTRRSGPKVEARSFPTVGFDQWLAAAGATHAGPVVTVESAMRNAAVAACVRVLTTTVASLPVDVVRVSAGVRTPVSPLPQVVRAPSGRVSQRGWVAQVMRSMLTSGNAYGQVRTTEGTGQRAQQVDTINPADVQWQTDRDGLLTPHVAGKPRAVWPSGDLLHVAASAFLPAGSPVAQSPVELAKQSIGTGLAAEEFGARFFGDGGHPSALIRSDQSLTKDQANAIKEAFLAATQGRREPAVFGSGLTYEAIQVSPTDSQFIDLMRFEVEQACRFFGVPPTMVYAAVSGQNITYANITHNDLHYLKYSVGIWLADIEDAWSSLLDPGVAVKFNVNAMLRMDAKARHELYSLRLGDKTMTVEEVRALEDEPPMDTLEESKAMGARDLAEALQKIYLSVGTVISADEAREILNREGAGFDIPGPIQPAPEGADE